METVIAEQKEINKIKMGSFQMLNCISKENLLYVKASNIFVGFEFRGNSSAAAYATVSYDGR